MSIAAELHAIGGILRCDRCGKERPLGDPVARIAGAGWPMCCGETMRWVTARELRAADPRRARKARR